MALDGSGDSLSIQDAIDSSLDGDHILVTSGRYLESIDFKGKSITLKSNSGPASTIIDGSSASKSTVSFISGEGAGSILEGFTVTGGSATHYDDVNRLGGGVLCRNSSPTIIKNIISENVAISDGSATGSWGGGFYILNSAPGQMTHLLENMIANNVASLNGGGGVIDGPCYAQGNSFTENQTLKGDGGGLYIFSKHVTIINNIFRLNRAADHGGAIDSRNPSPSGTAADLIIEGNLVIGNSSSTSVASDCSGGGMRIRGGAIIASNTICYNSASALAPSAGGGLCLLNPSPGTLVVRNILYRNQEAAIATYRFGGASYSLVLARNLIFGNGLINVHVGEGFEISELGTVSADPMLCTEGAQSDGSLAQASPALNQPDGHIGAVASPACSPGIAVTTVPTTWGRLKRIHSN